LEIKGAVPSHDLTECCFADQQNVLIVFGENFFTDVPHRHSLPGRPLVHHLVANIFTYLSHFLGEMVNDIRAAADQPAEQRLLKVHIDDGLLFLNFCRQGQGCLEVDEPIYLLQLTQVLLYLYLLH
jgi:hypothetical protein